MRLGEHTRVLVNRGGELLVVKVVATSHRGGTWGWRASEPGSNEPVACGFLHDTALGAAKEAAWWLML